MIAEIKNGAGWEQDYKGIGKKILCRWRRCFPRGSQSLGEEKKVISGSQEEEGGSREGSKQWSGGSDRHSDLRAPIACSLRQE